MAYACSRSLTLIAFFLIAVPGWNGYVNGQEKQECGWPNPAAASSKSDRIYGGVETAPHEFPWAVRLDLVVYQFQNDTVSTEISQVCFGSLISDEWVLTLASCLPKNITGGYATLGIYDVSANEPERIKVNLTDYRTNDRVSLFQLPKPITFNDYIRPICLPAIDDENDHVGDVALLIGWDPPNYEDPYRRDGPLLMVNSTVISKQECGSSSDMMCTSTDGGTVGSCADKGGAIMYRPHQESPWTLIGMLTAVHNGGCGSVNPEPNLRLQPHVQWIQNITNIV